MHQQTLALSPMEPSSEQAALDTGTIYILERDGRYSNDWSGHVCGGRYVQSAGAPHRTVHVISRPAGGEIRGYITIDGSPLYLRTPAYPAEWDALDLAVSERLGLPVVTREIP